MLDFHTHSCTLSNTKGFSATSAPTHAQTYELNSLYTIAMPRYIYIEQKFEPPSLLRLFRPRLDEH